MKIYTYLSAMEKARAALYTTKMDDNFVHHNRQYWKFRERLIRKVENLLVTESRCADLNNDISQLQKELDHAKGN